MMLLSHKCFPIKAEDEKEFSTTSFNTALQSRASYPAGGSGRFPVGTPQPFTPGSEEEMASEPFPLPAFTGCFKCWDDLKILFYFAIKFNF